MMKSSAAPFATELRKALKLSSPLAEDIVLECRRNAHEPQGFDIRFEDKNQYDGIAPITRFAAILEEITANPNIYHIGTPLKAQNDYYPNTTTLSVTLTGEREQIVQAIHYAARVVDMHCQMGNKSHDPDFRLIQTRQQSEQALVAERIGGF